MSTVTIDVNGMAEVVRGLEQGVATVTDARRGLSATLDRFDLDASRSWALQRAVDWAQTELPGVRRRLALAQALEGSNPSWPAGTVQLDAEPTFSTMTPEAARAAGRELALDLTAAGQQPPTEDEIARLEELGNDPYFASGFASALDPDQLTGVVLAWSQARTPPGQCLDDAECAERNAWYGRAVAAVSTTLGTATRATGDLALPSGYARGWAEAITAEVQSGMYPDGTGMVGQANALSLLLTSGRFSLSFLGTVADTVYAYERAFVAEYPRGSVWGPRSGDPSTLNAVYDAEGRQVRDPLAGIMAALAKDPAAAQNFFAGGDATTVVIDGQELRVSERLAYLIVDRTWAIDTTNGGALGQALVAATTMLRDSAGSGQVSAEIASQAFALIGEETGEGTDRDGVSADNGWQMWDGMRPYVAQMLASYGADVFRARLVGDNAPGDEGWSTPGSGNLFPSDMPHGARLSLEGVERIVATLGENQPDFAIFLAGIFQAGNLAIDTGLKRALAEDPNAGANLLTQLSDHSNPSITNASIMVGWALDTGLEGAMSDEATQKKQMEAIAAALSLIAEAPFVPEIKPSALDWGLDQARRQAISEVKTSAPTSAAGTYDDLKAKAEDDLGFMVLNLLLRNGFVDQAEIDAMLPGTIEYSDAGEALCFNTESEAFKRWLRTSALSTFVAESVVGVMLDQ